MHTEDSNKEDFAPATGPVSDEQRKGAHWILSSGEEVLARPGEPWRPMVSDEYRWSGLQVQSESLLGRLGDQWLCLAEIGEGESSLEGLLKDWQPLNLYKLLPGVSQQYYGILSRARQILHWQREHRHCGRCGEPTRMDAAEPALRCSACPALWYPKVTPCVITLVLRGEKLLLARNASFPGRFFSTLAGFVEVGENLEQTLGREVMEEVSVRAANFRYYASQSWPFPSQLMLGFFADYQSGEIQPDGKEIVEADWYHYKQLPPVPPPGFSIAGELIATAVAALERGETP